jgi:SAM-dependent methyltransferase
VIISLLLSVIAIFLLVLSANPDFRARNFANLCVSQNLKGAPLDAHRCSVLEQGNISGKVMEFGPGPGTNFKCFQNMTSLSIDKYVAVEPNTYFEEKIADEKKARGLEFTLEFVGIKGENVDISDEGTYDVVILTHVLCSVDSAEVVLANADRALKKGGRLIFMEHVLASEGSTLHWIQKQFIAPVLQSVGNGCKFLNLHEVVENHLRSDFDVEITDFEAPMPKFMFFASPHIKGVAIKK